SDTGVGSQLEEFQQLIYTSTSNRNWDGVLSVTTTGEFSAAVEPSYVIAGVSDNEISHYHLNLREIGSARSGTEVSMTTSVSIDDLTAEVKHFFQKMLILKIPDIVVEMVVEGGECLGSQLENFTLANEGITASLPPSTIERLKLGLEEYVLKHGNRLNTREHVKVGIAVACNESCSNLGKMVEAAVAITEISEMSNPCSSRSSDNQTEVLYFRDFSPRPISQSTVNALSSIDWNTYGLTLKSVADQDGHVILEWENLPSGTHIDIVLHSHRNQYPLFCLKVMIPLARKTNQLERKLTKRAVKLALDDLKKTHAGVLISSRAQKICSYAPDLAKAICGLILTSNDGYFQRQCISLLGLQPQEIGEQTVEECIKEKIISVVEMNDGKPGRSRESAPLFDEPFEEPDFQNQDEMNFGYMEL
ncbi:hypothetical protein RJ641_012694, partial [Dillenia turbinata]